MVIQLVKGLGVFLFYAWQQYVSCECDELQEECCASRAVLMKAISGLCCFRRDSPAASPELSGVRELGHDP